MRATLGPTRVCFTQLIRPQTPPLIYFAFETVINCATWMISARKRVKARRVYGAADVELRSKPSMELS